MHNIKTYRIKFSINWFNLESKDCIFSRTCVFYFSTAFNEACRDIYLEGMQRLA